MTDDDPTAYITALLRRGVSAPDIARRLKASPQLVGAIADELFGLGGDSLTADRVAPDTPRLRLYVQGLTDSQIARMEGTNTAQVRGWRRFYGLESNYVTKPEEPCGTTAAYRKHSRRGEKPCQACREAHADARRKRAAQRAQQDERKAS